MIVTNSATRVAYNIVRSLARSGLRVGVGVDSNSGMAVYSRFSSGSFRHPFADQDPLGFMAAVRAAILARGPAVYMPADEEIFVIAEYAHLLGDLPVRTAVASAETLRRLDNKHESIVLANSLGIPTPATIRPDSLSEVTSFAREHPGPLMVKILRSSGARGVQKLQPEHLATALPQFLRRTGNGFGEFVVQEYIEATGYGVSMLFDHGQMKASFAHRRLRERSVSGGPSTLRQSIRQPVLEAYTERMLRQVGYHGVAMIEFKHDEVSGQSWLLEVNPRWWGSLALAIKAGVDFPMLFHRMALGENLPPPPDYQTGVTVRWLLGDLLAYKNRVGSEQRLPGGGSLFPEVDGYDDAHLDDPLPLVAELLLHLRKTLKSRLKKRFRPQK